MNLKNKTVHVGVVSAMPEELGSIKEKIKDVNTETFGDLTVFQGVWKEDLNQKIVISAAFSGWGKVCAARATTRIISSKYKGKKVDFILFTGVAGAAKKKLNQWDIVVADSVVQHDFDARPLFEKYEIPSLRKKFLTPDKILTEKIYSVLNLNKNQGGLNRFGEIYKGLIGTGDKFISDPQKLGNILNNLPNLYALEMEGAALAQVAEQEKIKWIIIRVISDSANKNANEDFEIFIEQYKLNSLDLIELFLNSL